MKLKKQNKNILTSKIMFSIVTKKNFYTKILKGYQDGAKLRLQENYQQPQMYRWYHFNDGKWRGTKEPLDQLREESEKAGSKLNIQKTWHSKN